MIFYIYNIGVDLYNGFNGLRHRINWTYFTVLDGLAHPLYSRGLKEWDSEKGFLIDTCLSAQDRYKTYLDYFRISY